MKKTILCLLIAFNCFPRLSAQDLRFGVKGGADFVNMRFDPSTEDWGVTSRLSYDAGLIINYSPYKRFQFQLESGFIEKGGQLKFINQNERWIFKYGYLSSQLNIIIKPTPRLNIEFGPELDKILYAKRKDIPGSVMVEKTSNFKQIEFSAFLGIGYEILPNAIINCRYTYGITPLIESIVYADPGPNYSFLIYNQYVSIGLRYYLWTLDFGK
jgi:hypothetical protein